MTTCYDTADCTDFVECEDPGFTTISCRSNVRWLACTDCHEVIATDLRGRHITFLWTEKLPIGWGTAPRDPDADPHLWS